MKTRPFSYEVAEEIGVSRTTLRGWLSSGKLGRYAFARTGPAQQPLVSWTPALIERARRHKAESYCQISVPSPKKVRPWIIVPHLVDGKGAEETARLIRHNRSWVCKKAEAVGLSTARCRYDFGRPVMKSDVDDLRNYVGLSPVAFSRFFGLPLQAAYSAGGRDFRINPSHAALIVTGRTSLIRKSDARDRARLACAIVPGFADAYSLSLKIFIATRYFLRRNAEATLDRWQDWLYESAERELTNGSADRVFVKFLPLAPDLSRFVGESFEFLRGRGVLAPLAQRAVGLRFGIERFAPRSAANVAAVRAIVAGAVLAEKARPALELKPARARGEREVVLDDSKVLEAARIYNERKAGQRRGSWPSACGIVFGDWSKAFGHRVRLRYTYLVENGQKQSERKMLGLPIGTEQERQTGTVSLSRELSAHPGAFL
jgi:hypothetical protein